MIKCALKKLLFGSILVFYENYAKIIVKCIFSKFGLKDLNSSASGNSFCYQSCKSQLVVCA